MTDFKFKTDSKSREFCESIIQEMILLFGISEPEAVGRMNKSWKGLEFIGGEELIYHEDEEYWANTIYYGNDSFWWQKPDDLEPLPYP